MQLLIPGYSITLCGKVFSHHVGRFLIPDIDKDGYHRVKLFYCGRSANWRIHRLMGIYFLGVDNGNDIDHKDRDRSHNKINNLQGLTRLENIQKRWQ